MSMYVTTGYELKSVADAIREKEGTSETLEFPGGFVTAIRSISSGVTGATMNDQSITPDAQGILNLGTVVRQHQDVSGKADKVNNATSGNFAELDTNGSLVDSGHKHSDYLTSHQDVSGKADKVSNATSGNFAGLDANGNLVDSGHSHSDYTATMTGATASTAGTAGLVPAPPAGSQMTQLCGDSTWKNIIVYSESTAPSNPFAGMVWLKKKV